MNERTGGLDGEELLSTRIQPLEAYIPINPDTLPPHAELYFQQVEKKGFIGRGNPILYITINNTIELLDDSRKVTRNLVANWPAYHGHLQKRFSNKGLISLGMCYYTEPVDEETFEELKDSCKVHDMTLENDYNSCDLFQIIKNASWKAKLNIFVKRMSHDSTLPIGFLRAINNSPGDLKGLIPDPDKDSPLCEEAAIEYLFDKDLKINDIQASARLYPAGIYGGLSSPTMFDEFNPPKRRPRSWRINTEEDVLNAVNGHNGYDNVVGSQFARNIPWNEALIGLSLEKILTSAIPNILDNMIEFVEN
ncbi:hypothetical protein GOV12_07580 [Candidatus Pacearchaeota archaeon]|nr:hypothetical protein [Candidatus Pacearchaeota archaeon]